MVVFLFQSLLDSPNRIYIPAVEEGAKAAADAISDAMTADFMVPVLVVECVIDGKQ